MKRVKKVFLLILSVSLWLNVSAQEKLHQHIKQAGESVEKKDYKAAQSSLQKALGEINTMMGKELLRALPVTLEAMKADTLEDTNGNSYPGVMTTGIMVSRDYLSEEKNVTITLMSNSPAAMSINMIIANPTLVNQEEGGQKVVTIGKFPALMSFEEEDKSADVQIPLGSSIMSVSADGFDSGDAIVALLTKLDIEGIKKLLGE